MKLHFCTRALLLAVVCATCAAVSAASLDERRREFESIQKDLEAILPDDHGTNEQKQAYVELAIDKYGKFVESYPKTAEAFDASFLAAGLLLQVRHPSAMKFVEMAATNAPESGVDIKRVAACWATLASFKLDSEDCVAARDAIEKIKKLDNGIYQKVNAGLGPQIEAIERLQPGKQPFPINEKSVSGKNLSLDLYAGKVVLIDFWAPWCGPCMGEMPDIKKMYEEKHANGLEIVGISLDNGEEELTATLKQLELPWEIISDHGGWKSAIPKKWGVHAIPRNYILDRKGVIREVNLHGAPLEKAIEKLIAEKP